MKSEEQTNMDRKSPIERLLLYFEFAHLPQHLQTISKPLCDLAHQMAESLPMDPETTMGLRKLLEAKDCFVRAKLSDSGS